MKKELQSKITCRGLSNMRLVAPLRTEDVPLVQAAADVLLLPLDDMIPDTAAPSKPIPYMLSGRAIIANIASESEPARTIRVAAAGCVLPPRDATKLAQTLAELARDPAAVKQYGQNARKYAEKNLRREVLLSQLVDLLESSGYIPRLQVQFVRCGGRTWFAATCATRRVSPRAGSGCAYVHAVTCQQPTPRVSGGAARPTPRLAPLRYPVGW